MIYTAENLPVVDPMDIRRIRNPWERRDRCALWLLKALVHHNLSLAPSMKYLSESIGKAWGHQPGDSA